MCLPVSTTVRGTGPKTLLLGQVICINARHTQHASIFASKSRKATSIESSVDIPIASLARAVCIAMAACVSQHKSCMCIEEISAELCYRSLCLEWSQVIPHC